MSEVIWLFIFLFSTLLNHSIYEKCIERKIQCANANRELNFELLENSFAVV